MLSVGGAFCVFIWPREEGIKHGKKARAFLVLASQLRNGLVLTAGPRGNSAKVSV